VNSQKGQALPIALVILAAGILIIAPFLDYASSNVTGSQTYGQSITEQYSADAGVEYAIWSLQNGELDVPEFALNNNTVNVTVESEGEGSYKITSVASGDDGSSITIEAYVNNITIYFTDGAELSHGDVIGGNAYVEGNLELNADAQIRGNAYVDGDLTLNFNAEITGYVIATGDIVLNAEAVIGGDICVGGDLILNARAVIQGNVYAAGNVELHNRARIEGDVHAGGYIILDVPPGVTPVGGDYPLPYEGCPLPALGDVDILSWQITSQSS
jgi:cytoskeletal protein CcmA (bactofilin family)